MHDHATELFEVGHMSHQVCSCLWRKHRPMDLEAEIDLCIAMSDAVYHEHNTDLYESSVFENYRVPVHGLPHSDCGVRESSKLGENHAFFDQRRVLEQKLTPWQSLESIRKAQYSFHSLSMQDIV